MSSWDLKIQRQQKKNQLDIYNRRLVAVTNIYNKSASYLEVKPTNINLWLDSVEGSFHDGLKGNNKGIVDKLDELKEKNIYVDSKISSSRASLSQEKRRCENKINSLIEEIRNLDIQIAAAEEAERREAERRAAEAAASKGK